MRRLPLAPLLLLLAAIVPARAASADDGAIIRRKPVAPIAGTPIWPEIEPSTPPRKARIPALVIAGGIVGGLGAAGALTGLALMSTSASSCKPVYSDSGQLIDTLCPTGQRGDIGLTTLLVGSSVAALGLTLLLVGIQPADEPEAPAARALPTISIGPTGGALTWRF